MIHTAAVLPLATFLVKCRTHMDRVWQMCRGSMQPRNTLKGQNRCFAFEKHFLGGSWGGAPAGRTVAMLRVDQLGGVGPRRRRRAPSPSSPRPPPLPARPASEPPASSRLYTASSSVTARRAAHPAATTGGGS